MESSSSRCGRLVVICIIIDTGRRTNPATCSNLPNVRIHLIVFGAGQGTNRRLAAAGRADSVERVNLFLTFLSRALRLRCPICGRGKLFRWWLLMHERCPNCGVKFEREPGFFLGSIYINYGLTALIVAIAYCCCCSSRACPSDPCSSAQWHLRSSSQSLFSLGA